MKKRMLAVLLAICLLMSALPAAARAAEVTASGTCGENLTWALDTDRTLTISGTGPMTVWEVSEDVPWARR